MSTEQIDFEGLGAALQKLFAVKTPEEGIAILQQHPELLSEEADMMLDKLIHHAREQGNDDEAQLFSHARELLQSLRQAIAEAQGNERNDMPEQIDFEGLWAALEKLFAIKTPEEGIVILQQHPELLSEEADMMLDNLIHHAREQGNDDDAQLFSHLREMLQSFREAIAEAQGNERNDMPEQIDFEGLWAALEKLFAIKTPEEGIVILQQHPELLSEEADMMLDNLIHHAREQGNDDDAQLFSHARELLQSIRQENQDNNIPPQFRADFNQAKTAEARYQLGGGVPTLDEAIAAWERILTHAEFSRVEKTFCLPVLNDSANSYLRRYWAASDFKDLEIAIAAWQQVVALTREHFPNSPDLPKFLNNLGTGLRDRYARTGDVKDLERGIEASQEAVALTRQHFPNSPDLPSRLNNLGTGLSTCYARTGDVKDLERGIDAYQQAVALTREHFPNSPELPFLLNNLGGGLSTRYARSTGDVKDLERGIDAYQQAVALTREHFPNSPDLPSLFNNLGTGLSTRYARTGDVNDLERGISAFQQAVALTRQHFPNSPELPSQLNNLGNGLRNRYARTGDVKDLERGIEVYQEAVALTREHFPNSPELPKFLNNLGNGLSDRYARTGDVKDLERGIDAYQQATQQGLDLATEISLGSARNWLRWAFNRQAWAEVAQAYNYAYQASTRLVQIQSMRQHQESWLKESQGLAAQAAYAFAKQNQLTKAAVTLERGLAQLLSEALARDRADLEQLKAQGHSELYDRYQQAVNDWHDAQRFANAFKHPTAEQYEQIYHNFRTAREALDNTITDIRQVEGYSDFLEPPSSKDIAAAVKDSTLVYLVATKAGGLALIVNRFLFWRTTKITPVWLPELTEETLQHILVSMEPPGSGYLRAYDDWRNHPKEDNYRQQWFTSLEKTTQLLWKQVMAPLIQALPKQAQVTLIPVGKLGLLPLHAAWTYDVTAPTGRRYALDALTISYAPNARALTQARKVAQRVTADRLLAVDEPKPVTNNKGKALPLPSSEYEVQTVVAKFAQPHIFKHEAATRQAILAALPDCNVLHCSCHGSANLKKPLESALMMAHNESLTVKDFLELRLNGVRLATLSACETGMPGMTLPDEVVNLPTGLLQAGIAGVVASLWSVNDMSTALLMIKFYQEVLTRWQEYGTQASIAPALQAAQCWLRDATKEELQAWVNQLTLTPAQRMQFMVFFSKMSEKPKPEKPEKPFSAPFYWAAFCAIGQ
jgi:CHAT domain-containing protein/tetratricopeptide (TPR) repeat protein